MRLCSTKLLHKLTIAFLFILFPLAAQEGEKKTLRVPHKEWVTFSSPKDGFSVELPSDPCFSFRQNIEVSGYQVEYAGFSAQGDEEGESYLVIAAHFPPKVLEKIEVASLLDSFVTSFQENGVEIIEKHLKKEGGITLVEFRGKGDEGEVKGRCFIARATLYSLVADASTPESLEENYAHFVGSFRLI